MYAIIDVQIITQLSRVCVVMPICADLVVLISPHTCTCNIHVVL